MREVRTREKDREKVREREVGRGGCSEGVNWRGEREEERGRLERGMGGGGKQGGSGGWVGEEKRETERETHRTTHTHNKYTHTHTLAAWLHIHTACVHKSR